MTDYNTFLSPSTTMPSPVTPPNRHLTLPCNPTSPSNASFFYRITVGNNVSDDTLKACADLFSSNYGIWGDKASKISTFTKAGQQLIYILGHCSAESFI
jgi:hypothetical protein